ncbi:hypothetical protein INT44_008102 [Umbelopsis vinacea]|uniref:Transcription factor domain-containing protein n=1 Tax=Umbelopsis vinacea TaxID=44442 RepID=A0A8H7UC79_9FUNG|nr:hypothetical protein INT44_008102 [Umbelopsis vinacea]
MSFRITHHTKAERFDSEPYPIDNPHNDIPEDTDRVSDVESDCSEHSVILFHVENYSELESIMQGFANRPSTPQHEDQFDLPNVLPDYTNPTPPILDIERMLRNPNPIISPIQMKVSYEDIMDVIMGKAQKDWCCLAFKIAPLKIDVAKDWRSRPKPIVDGLAAITLATFIGKDCTEDFGMATAAAFYKQASNRMDVLFDSMNADAVLAYFCLSYASNLMRLYDQQKTWGSLASIALFHLTQTDKSGPNFQELIRLCWCRWYYIDAWVGLSLNRPLFLRREHPMHIPTLTEMIEHNTVTDPDTLNLFHFAALGGVIRRAITGLKFRAFFDPNAPEGHVLPSKAYMDFTNDHRSWFALLQDATLSERSDIGFVGPRKFNFKPKVDVHLHMSYHSIRLVILFQFLLPNSLPPDDMIFDSLDTISELLSGLQYLHEIGCDQSTYHHMFFAIHNAAKIIYHYAENDASTRVIAREQMLLNNQLLRGTSAYENDLFKLRFYGEKIDSDFELLGIEHAHEPLVDDFSIQVFRADPIPITIRKKRSKKKGSMRMVSNKQQGSR